MKQITIQTAKAQILIVDLPQDAHHVQLSLNKHSDILYLAKGSPFFVGIEIPNEDWQLLGKASELTEEQWRTIVDDVIVVVAELGQTAHQGRGFKNYKGGAAYHSVVESGSSLLSANGVMLENPCGEEPDPIIIDQFPEQVCCGFPTPNGSCCGSGVIQWKQEQIENPDWIKWRNEDEKVWSNPYVLIETN